MRVGASCREGAHAAAIVGGRAFLFPFFPFFLPFFLWASDFPLSHSGWGTDRGVVEGGGGIEKWEWEWAGGEEGAVEGGERCGAEKKSRRQVRMICTVKCVYVWTMVIM